MEIITQAIIRDSKTAEIFRNLHSYTKEDSIQSFDEEGTELLVLGNFENILDELIEDYKRILNSENECCWFNVDDEFTMDELIIAKNEMVALREAGLKSMTVYC